MNETTTEQKEFFTEKEALESILNFLKDDMYNCCVEELHDYVFNPYDYYIIGVAEARKALNQYGTRKALEEVKDFEEENFGEVGTDLTSPKAVANMLEYIIVDNVTTSLGSTDEYYYNKLDDESDKMGKTVRQVIIEEVSSLIDEL